MTVVDDDRIHMAESNDERILDEMFESLERGPFSEGYRIDVIGGVAYMSPQRTVHWRIIRRIVRALEDTFGMDAEVTSDVRIDFPGRLNGFCPDVAKMRDGAVLDSQGRWRYQDVEFIAEVISKETAANDYGPKKAVYAAAEVPVYLIADPYQGRCHLYTQPKGDDYLTETTVAFGVDIDLTRTPLGLTLTTADFPRD
ncbi:Uma2 family endonuclease [Streptomyces sp. CB03238]|uniref:Uma2 family endonuclease n=1 Tax=Streptomyces sp. CB03238 TaxID=1907777 RepID=UPI000A116F8D|nr:Uma2 family endonuclease [Streptomyces sp. CB03238]ORT58786.1 hypothetical protein BKD26_16555 [Streptomyces sp. CB03238]